MEENITLTRDPKTFYFDFDWPKDLDKNLKHKTQFIIKSNKFLPENQIKNKIKQLLLKYMHGNNIHEIYNTEISKTNEPPKFVLNLSTTPMKFE